MTPLTLPEIAAAEARAEAAHNLVVALCNGDIRWRMSIPAQPNSDPDLVIGASLRDNTRLAATARTALQQRDAAVKLLQEYMDFIEERDMPKWEHQVDAFLAQVGKGGA